MPSLYGIFVSAGGLTAVFWLRRRLARIGVTENVFWTGVWAMLLGAVLGAKALFVALGWEHYARGELRFWADFGTGFVFFGGLLGAALAGWAVARGAGVSFARAADYFAVAVPMGHAIGRIGCFFEGCCHGRPPHPVQLYEAVGLALIAWSCQSALAGVEAGARPPGSAFRRYALLYGLLRLLLDPLRGDGRTERWLGLSHQQGMALAVIAVAVLWPRRIAAPRASRSYLEHGRR